ncbi:TetR family transcriptional regulator [Streptomyces chrestomyceticus JCM 4735]|uniref:TetR family transcriptional regulator n=1 Tax=Streptomyces chrestomyceticus JCM 4735 TaxID=1306181 RepID=A0A7U9L266_9ACTN|nr:TetR family transcriptional regulator [Streptomyces chrestomyceticus JCM 4735]
MTEPAPRIEPPAPAPAGTGAPVGRRERKKAQTRQALADAALRLFLERGFEQVGVKEIAEAADVSVTTLFKHFASKEALVFDLEGDIEASLVAAVRDRAPGQSILQALRAYVLLTQEHAASLDVTAFARLVADTPRYATTPTACGCATKRPWHAPSPRKPALPRTTSPAPPWPTSPSPPALSRAGGPHPARPPKKSSTCWSGDGRRSARRADGRAAGRRRGSGSGRRRP